MSFTVDFYTYNEVIDAVSSETVFAALINKDIASYLPAEKMQDLVMVSTIERNIPIMAIYFISGLDYYGSKAKLASQMTCWNTFTNDIIHNSKEKFFKPVTVSVNSNQYIIHAKNFQSQQ